MKTLLTVYLLLLFGLPSSADAACTKGTNCFCDTATSSGRLLCEDFDAPTLYSDTGYGNGAPLYGPPYDPTGGSNGANDRGANSYWNKKYSGAVSQIHWANTEPASPTLGPTCSTTLCNGLKQWEASNLWNANAYSPKLFFPTQASDFTAEIGTLSAPTNTSNGVAGIFAGNASLAHRIPAGTTSGITGRAAFGSLVTTFSITEAVAYPTNLCAANSVTTSNWKNNEFEYDLGVTGGDGLFLFGKNLVCNTLFPFHQFTFSTSSMGATEAAKKATCDTRKAAATVTKGTLGCDNAGNFTWGAASADYARSTDWPLGTWGCAREEIRDFGTTNSGATIWFTPTAGPNAGVEQILVNFTGMDLTGHTANYGGTPGYTAMNWNAYANANQGGDTGPTTETFFRYEDNLFIKSGLTPLTCAQIGFGGGAPVLTNPRQPINLRRAEVENFVELRDEGDYVTRVSR